MTRGWLLALTVAVTMVSRLGAARAEGDPPGCPPDEWFCGDTEEGAPPPGEADADAPSDDGYTESSDEWIDAPGERGIDVRRPAPAPPAHVRWSEGSGGLPSSPWALALRVEGLLLDAKRRETSLGGVGVSGRYTLGPAVTLDLGLDSILGTDYDGNERAELSLSFSSLFFLNYHPVVRTYVLVGLNTSRARVDVRGDDQTWGYFGAQTGLGLEIVLDRRIALNVDFLGFMRGRTDSRAAREPEFTDSSGRVTNTSGGGMLRGGVALRF